MVKSDESYIGIYLEKFIEKIEDLKDNQTKKQLSRPTLTRWR